jgi:RNA polymerase sigma factor (sigma-70 family)
MKNKPMHPQRPGGRLFTARELLEGHWPDIERAVRASLLRRGVGREDADDILQETALRAVSGPFRFDGPEGFRRWAFVVAKHLTIDQARCRRTTTVAVVPDAPTAGAEADVAATVEGRMVAAGVVSAFHQLSANDRTAITTGFDHADQVGRPPSRREYVKFAVRRHRARQRLMALCEGLLAVLVVACRRVLRPATQLTAVAVPLGMGFMLWSARFPQVRSPAVPGVVALSVPAAGRPEVAPVRVSPPIRVVPPAPPRIPSGHEAASRAADPSHGTTLAVVQVAAAGNTGLRTRTRENEDHDACADTIVAGTHCVDAPPLPPHVDP